MSNFKIIVWVGKKYERKYTDRNERQIVYRTSKEISHLEKHLFVKGTNLKESATCKSHIYFQRKCLNSKHCERMYVFKGNV